MRGRVDAAEPRPVIDGGDAPMIRRRLPADMIDPRDRTIVDDEGERRLRFEPQRQRQCGLDGAAVRDRDDVASAVQLVSASSRFSSCVQSNIVLACAVDPGSDATSPQPAAIAMRFIVMLVLDARCGNHRTSLSPMRGARGGREREVGSA